MFALNLQSAVVGYGDVDDIFDVEELDEEEVGQLVLLVFFVEGLLEIDVLFHNFLDGDVVPEQLIDIVRL